MCIEAIAWLLNGDMWKKWYQDNYLVSLDAEFLENNILIQNPLKYY